MNRIRVTAGQKMSIMMYKFGMFFLGLAVVCTSGLHTVSLYREPDALKSMLETCCDDIPGIIDSRSSHQLELSTYKNLQYYANITIGSPPKQFLTAFDTGSIVTWVVSKNCDVTSCENHERYDSASSHSSHIANGSRVNYKYGPGEIAGPVGNDIFRVDQLEALQTFIDADSIDDDLVDMKFDALIGMGFRSKAFSKSPTLIESLAERERIEPVFSLYFNRDTKSTKGGLLTLGSTNSAHYGGDIHYVPVVTETHWSFSMEYVHLGITEISTTYVQAKVDSGQALISAPSDMAIKIYGHLGATVSRDHALQTVECDTADTLPDLTFSIAGRPFRVPSTSYIVRKGTGSGTVCYIGIFRSHETHWVFGDTFLGLYYSVYEPGKKRVGFAAAVHPYIG